LPTEATTFEPRAGQHEDVAAHGRIRMPDAAPGRGCCAWTSIRPPRTGKRCGQREKNQKTAGYH
jgi:hypothetical protein